MKILIDECVPRSVKSILTGHAAYTVQELGCSGYKNGDLLQLAESQFDLFITSDQNIKYQQNLQGRRIAILMLSTNKGSMLKANGEQILSAVNSITPAAYVELNLS